MSETAQTGTLFVVATPLGNLEDFSPRAGRVLAEADVIYAEDTRRTRKLLSHLGLSRPLRSLHEHNERSRLAEVTGALERGETVVLVSDAGTPVVSDPGADLVAAAREAGFRVSPIPGPSAITAALSVAGFGAASSDALFLGFLPRKGKERRAALERIGAHRGVVVLFEAPGRLAGTLGDLAALDGERSACVCRELTKVYEEIRTDRLAELATWAESEIKGEITLVIGPTQVVEVAADDAAIDAALERCIAAGLSARDAATAVAAVLGIKRRRVYERAKGM